MCERCDKANHNLEERKTEIARMTAQAIKILRGNYTEEQQEMMKADGGFPKDKPFMEFLFRFGSAAALLAQAQALIVDELPSSILREWLRVTLETEIECGIGPNLETMLSDLFGGDVTVIRLPIGEFMDDSDGDKPTLH